jgi:hypothetical protein
MTLSIKTCSIAAPVIVTFNIPVKILAHRIISILMLLQGTPTEGEGSVQLTCLLTSPQPLLLILKTFFTYLQNKPT